MSKPTFRLPIAALILFMSLLCLSFPASAELKFKRIPTQFIAALGDPNATSGTGAEKWGIWRQDPGPRGVWLRQFGMLQAAGGFGPGNWQFDDKDWWLDENGIIMERPQFPVGPGKYMVTGERKVTTVLTIYPKDENGVQRWELEGAKLYDVTHLPCRSARYTPASGTTSCSPAAAPVPAFPISPGATMPAVDGCKKQDYAVLFIVGIPAE